MKLSGNQVTKAADACVLVHASKIVEDGNSCEIKVDNSTTIDLDGNRDDDNGQDFWQNPFDFVFSCLSLSIGLGNVWRFPMAVNENGGGAFLIAYVVILCLIGRPLYLLEMSLGQFSSSGPVAIWSISPVFRGVGYTAMFCTFCAVTYYASLMSLTLCYLLGSFNSVLPWSECDTPWIDEALCIGGVFQFNLTNTSLPELYYRNKAFKEWKSIEDGIGLPYFHLAICLLISWCIIYASLVHGLKYLGKLAYVTSTLPIFALVVLAARGLTLPGSQKGLEFLVRMDWAELFNAKIWYAATSQCLFSLSAGAGPLTYLASKNHFKHNIYRDSLLIVIFDTLTSGVAAVAIFAITGSLAEELNVNVSDVISDGTSMAFITYPHAISKLEFLPQLSSALFFLTLFTLGLGSANAMTGAVVSILSDKVQHSYKWLVALVVCAAGFFVGLVYVTPGGRFLVNLMDHYGCGFVIHITVLLEVIAVCWIYGLDNFSKDTEFMLGKRIGFWSNLSYWLAIPLGLVVILVHIFTVEEHTIRNLPGLPASAIASGWILSSFALLLIPVFAFREVYFAKSKTIIEKIKISMRPDKQWGPKKRAIRKSWMQCKDKRAPNDFNN